MFKKNLFGPLNVVYRGLFLLMDFSRSWFLLVVLSTLTIKVTAQDAPGPRKGSRIIDDTTKQVYGPNTSRYFFEQEVFFNREVLHPIDTLIKDFHQWDYVRRFNYLYQDLGNVGTAIRPTYYQTPDIIGARSGAHVYDLYWDTEPIKYFDTKSPYSNMRVILGGKGRSFTRATFSRNINPNWNFGFTYRGLFIDKQVQRTGKGDRITRGNYYDAYTAYQTKDSTYRVFFNFRRNFHRVEEFGGIKTTTPFLLEDFYEENSNPWLTAAESNDLRKNTHLFHQYRVGKALQAYHVADWYRQKNKFIDIPNPATDPFYDSVAIERRNPNDTTNDVTLFKTGRHEFGIKGNISKVFYNGYYAIRNYQMLYNHFNVDTIPELVEHPTYDSLRVRTSGTESYLGGRIAIILDSIGEVSGWLEVMDQGNYRFQGEIKSRWFEARLKEMRYAPGFIEQAYLGRHDFWNNNFANTATTQFNGYLHYNSQVLKISPGLTFTRLRNYVFYKQVSQEDSVQQVLPIQSGGNQIMVSPELRLSLTFFKHITLSSQIIYTRFIENADNAFQIPELFVNGQLSYSNIFFNGNLDMHAGVDLHWQSNYFAPAYDPAIRQYYVQNTFLIQSFPIVDLFFNAKIKRGRVFFKYHNFIQAFTKTGYLTAPYYPGQANIFDFGFDWSFYD